jgi:hypothetical protein
MDTAWELVDSTVLESESSYMEHNHCCIYFQESQLSNINASHIFVYWLIICATQDAIVNGTVLVICIFKACSLFINPLNITFSLYF